MRNDSPVSVAQQCQKCYPFPYPVGGVKGHILIANIQTDR